MHYNPLGSTGLEVSAVSFGTSPLGNMFGVADEAAARHAIGRALDAGINVFDSSPYYGGGLAEERLGRALGGQRDHVVLATKAGRYGLESFDFTPATIRASLERSLRLLRVEAVDVFQLHDIEYGNLDDVFGDAYLEMVKLRDEGMCRFIGMTGYPTATLRAAVESVDLDVVLTYAHHTLLDTCLQTTLLPHARRRHVGVINAAAVALGLLTPHGPRIDHPAGERIRAAARDARAVCEQRGVDISFLANQFAIQRSGCSTTVIGTVNPDHLDAAVAAADTPIDEDLLHEVLDATAHVNGHCWTSGPAQTN